MSNIKQLNNLIRSDILPDEINYSCLRQQNQNTVDISKLQYNAFYRSYDFFMSKYPKGMETIPGFTDYIDYVVETKVDNTPLKELKEINDLNETKDKLYSA